MVNEEILKACRKRDRKAQFELYKECYGFLMAICRRYYSNKEDAEAVLNKAFLKILDNLKKYKTEVPFKLWIRKIMMNTLIDEFRKNRKYMEQIVTGNDVIVEGNSSSSNLGDLELDANYLYEMLDKLPDMSKQVFCLFAIDGFKHHEISKDLGITEGTSKWHVANARNLLKGMIDRVEKKTLVKAI